MIPRILDAVQPMLKGAEAKLRRCLTDFKFVDVATANQAVDWGKVPVVKL